MVSKAIVHNVKLIDMEFLGAIIFISSNCLAFYLFSVQGELL